MKINFRRWTVIAVLGCLTIGTALLPADGSKPLVSWFVTPQRGRVEKWQTRLYARSNHESSLLSAYVATRDIEIARELFGSSAGKVGEPDVRFAADVPAAMRVKFMRALGEERSERPEWKGNGKVGVIVRIDTATLINGQKLARLNSRMSGRTTSRAIVPSAATGDRCVVIVKLPTGAAGAAWGPAIRGIPADAPRPLLDGCGFYDAFGTPGAQIANDVSDDRFFFARGYAWTTAPRDTAKHAHYYAFQQWYFDASDIRCLAFDDQACVDHFRGKHDATWDYWYASTVPQPAGISPERQLFRDLPAPSQLNRIVLEVGPQRFSRIWQSPKPLDQAYFDETGRTLGQFVRGTETHEYGIYHPGPWTSWLTVTLTLLTIAMLFALALRFGDRPRVA